MTFSTSTNEMVMFTSLQLQATSPWESGSAHPSSLVGHGKECQHGVRVDCGRTDGVNCGWCVRVVGFTSYECEGGGGAAITSSSTATIGRTRGEARAQQAAAIEGVWAWVAVTTFGLKVRGRGKWNRMQRGVLWGELVEFFRMVPSNRCESVGKAD